MEWVDEDILRAHLLARMIPLHESEPYRHPMARKLILRFRNNQEIQDAILSNWYTEGYSGKTSEHYKRKLKVLEEWEKDSDKIISEWAS